jgi:predicted nucleic acid-binding protein
VVVTGLLLVDKSAFVRTSPDRLARLASGDELCLCAITRLEILYSARSRADYEALEVDLDEFRELRVDAQTISTAVAAQRELGHAGQQRIPIPDLLVASTAHQHGADVLHVDRHFDTLARVLAFQPRRG